jgi:malate dehydrogenase (oxaloacetate-decarboxylating)(NADP+)
VLAVARQIIRDGVGTPVLFGDATKIRDGMKGFDASEFEVIDPAKPPRNEMIETKFRERSGMFADKRELDSYSLAALMTDLGMVDGMLSAADRIYRETVPYVLKLVSRRPGVRRVVGMHIMVLNNRVLFFADTTLNINPGSEDLADCARLCAEAAHALGATPRVAFISYNNFGSSHHAESEKVRSALAQFRAQNPGIESIGEVQADVALAPGEFRNIVDDKTWGEPANVLIFPNLDAANAAFRLVRVTAEATALGPLLLGLKRPANVMPRGSSVQDAVSMAAVTLAMPQLASESGVQAQAQG